MTKVRLAILALGLSLGGAAVPAFAQDAHEAQLIGFHQLCNRGDRAACVKFGMMLQQGRDHHDEWRRTHPEFFFFEH